MWVVAGVYFEFYLPQNMGVKAEISVLLLLLFLLLPNS